MLFGKLFTNPKMWVNWDADEITMGGVYICKDVQNVPTGDGALFVFKTENTVKQVFIPVGEEGVVYTRVLGEEWASVTGTSEETEALIQSAIDKANQAQAKADLVDTKLNNIIVESGTSDAEVVAARTDSSGQTFTTLGQRLDTQFGEVKEDLSASQSLLIGEGVANTSIWENGSVSGQGGNTANSTRIRTKVNRLLGFANGQLYVVCGADYEMFFPAYNQSGTYVGRLQEDGKVGDASGAWVQSLNLIDYSEYLFRIVLRYKNTPTADIAVSESSNVLFSGEKYAEKVEGIDTNPYVYDTVQVTLENGVYDRLNNLANNGKHCVVNVAKDDKYIVVAMSYVSTDYPVWMLKKGNTVVAYQNVASSQMVQLEVSVNVDADTLVINSQSYISLQKGEVVKAKPYSKWHGKKIAWFGTSIPESSTYNAVLGYPEYVGKLLGATVYNEARGSSCARRGFKSAQSANDPYGWTGMGYKGALYNMGSNHEEKQEMLDNWDTKWKALVGGDHTLTDGDRTLAMYYSYETVLQQHITTPVDLYVFDHGYNDWSSNSVNMEMNENDPFDRSTYQGAMNTFIKLILTANPRAKILLLSHYETQERPTLVPMQKEVAEYWNLPFCEICNYLGWANDRTVTTDGYWSNGSGNGIWVASGGTEQTYTLKQLHIPDGKHPNLDISGNACMDIANIIADFINTITPTP